MNNLGPHVEGHFFRRVASGFIVAALAGCAAMGGGPPEQVVKERAQARWNALLSGDYKAAYAYMSPGSRAVLSESAYIGSLGTGFWKSAQVNTVTCREDKVCDVGTTIEYEHQGHRIRTPLRESWIRDGGEWWYVKQ